MTAGTRQPWITDEESRLIGLLRFLGLLFFGAAFLYGLGPFFGSAGAAFGHLPWAAASVAKVSLLGAMCLYAAADLRRRRVVVTLVALAHLFTVVAMIVLRLFGTVAGNLAGTDLSLSTAMWVATGLDGVIFLILLFFLGAAGKPEADAGIYGLDDHEPISSGEGALRTFATVFGLLCFAIAASLVSLLVLGAWPELLAQVPIVTNVGVALVATGLICLYATMDIRARQSLLGLVPYSLTLGTLVLIGYWFVGAGSDVTVSFAGRSWAMPDLLLLAAAPCGAAAAVLMTLYQSAWRTRYKLEFLAPMEFRTLLGMSEVLIEGEDQAISPLEVAHNVDATIYSIGARRRWIYRAILFIVYLHPLFYLRAPLPELVFRARENHLKGHFYWDTLSDLVPGFIRQFVSAMIRVAKQLVYVGYYGDERTFERVGYTPFSKRPPQAGEGPRTVSDTTLEVWGVDHPRIAGESRLRADVCVIGSGAAGGIIALELAKRRPDARILVVERGKYVAPADFKEDEIAMMGALYADGLFQQTRDNKFTILQGSCVGGTTVVNNAVSFKPKRETLAEWKADFGVDFNGDLDASLDAVWQYLKIQPQAEDILNPSALPFVDKMGSPNITRPLAESGVVAANIKDCLGCGYCNIGCSYGKKLSLLETALPDAQKIGQVAIISDCKVERLRTTSGSPLRVRTALARLASPLSPHSDRGARHIEIEAETFVVAAGAVATPWLLRSSSIGPKLPVGDGMSFNMGAAITGVFPDTSSFRGGHRAYEGLQISHYGLPDWNRGWVLETWWNPPVAQAVNMPGWFNHHYDNMRDYSNMMAVGVLVGTGSEAKVRPALTGGPDVVYQPSQHDRAKLADGLMTTAEILFEAGAERLLLNTADIKGEGDALRTRADLEKIREICLSPSSGLGLGTGHPQGGNALGTDPRTSVVNSENFKVHGYDNLYVCDASVFPTSVTVNPQVTVMGLAHLAAQKVRL